VTAVAAPSASGGAYLDMRNGGTITFENVEAEAEGDYLLVFGYSLAYDVPKSQFIAVNGERLAEVRFNGARNVWLERGLRVPLRAGPNTVRIESGWGWMYFDYLALSAQPFVGAEPEGPGREEATLAPGYPNPFSAEAHIPYTLPRAEHVVLEVFDVTGRRVAVLVDEVQPAGVHLARFRGEGLSAGPYLVRLRAGASAQTHRLLLLR
jgi:hypothetical protein